MLSVLAQGSDQGESLYKFRYSGNLADLNLSNYSSPQFRTELEKLQDIAATEDSLDLSRFEYGDLIYIPSGQLGQGPGNKCEDNDPAGIDPDIDSE